MRFFYLALILFSFSLHAQDEKFQKLIKDFEAYAQAQQKIWNIPGMAIGIIKDQEVVLAKGYGQRGLNDTRPVDEKTVFQIGSLSKAFTSALVAQAVDQGLIKWDDKVYESFPTFRLADPWATAEFQIVDLLAQRSGLPQYAGDTQAFFGFSADEMVNNLHYIKPITSFRSQYAYQNIFFVIASQLLTNKTKLSYEEMLKKSIFDPLKMNKSTASLESYLKEENRAGWIMRLNNGSNSLLKDDFIGNDWNYILGAAGGINSNIDDMTKWLIFQANQGKYENKQLITIQNMERMTRPMIYALNIDTIDLFYALGWVHMESSPYPIIWHDGSTLGVYNVAAFIPQEKVGIVILSNVRGTSLSFALALQFFDMYYGRPDQDWSQKVLAKDKEKAAEIKKDSKTVSPSLPLSSYAGKYQNPVYVDTLIKEENGGLVLVIGKNKQQFKMTPFDGNIFTSTWICGEEMPAKLNFIQGPDGKIAKMQIDLLMKEGNGEFDKIVEKPKQ